jgi:putative CRISPR-associated protein (TIGR02619 family)
MNKPLFVLSPCGTSLLTNQGNLEQRKLIAKYANFPYFADIPQTDSENLTSLIEQVSVKMSSADLTEAAKMSAELNCITKIYQGQINSSQDYHLLLCTDTWLGENTANLVATWLKKKGLTVEVKRQQDLQTKDIISFQSALSDLVEWCQTTVLGYRHSGYHVIFNLTGGFKSVQGFLQTLANLYADEAVYVFESSTDLLRIPRLPVDMAAEDTVKKNLGIFRRLAQDLIVTNTADIPETLLMKIGDNVGLSPWGDLVWGETKFKIYQEGIYPSPSDKIVFGEKFEKSLAGLAPDRLVLVNEKLDQLAKCLETDNQNNPKSLSFKQLTSNPYPPCTHEFYAWSDGNASRIFGYYEKDVFIVDRLDRHL